MKRELAGTGTSQLPLLSAPYMERESTAKHTRASNRRHPGATYTFYVTGFYKLTSSSECVLAGMRAPMLKGLLRTNFGSHTKPRAESSKVVKNDLPTLAHILWLHPLSHPERANPYFIIGGRMHDDLKMQNGAPRLAYRLSDLARAVGLSTRYLRKEIHTGKLIARKFGAATLVLHDDAVNWLKAHPPVNEANEIASATP